MQQFKQYAEAMKIIGEMAYEAFRNPEDPNSEHSKETSPISGIMGKLLGDAEVLGNANSTPAERDEALAHIELVSEDVTLDHVEEADGVPVAAWEVLSHELSERFHRHILLLEP